MLYEGIIELSTDPNITLNNLNYMPTIIKKAVFPVAGLGTRFLPATKANPKEMLPVVDKPLIQYAVEEAISAGIKELIFVTSSSKRAIEDHFDSNYELESRLEAKAQYDLLSVVRNIPVGVSCVYIRQNQPLGLGHAILCAQPAIGNEPFAVLLADDLLESPGANCLSDMVAEFQQCQSSILAVQEVPLEETKKYGIVALAENSAKEHIDAQPLAVASKTCNTAEKAMAKRITAIVEKPSPQEAPSNLAAIGRYILTPTVFSLLTELPLGKGGEIQLTDAIDRLVSLEPVYAHYFAGKRYDCGTPLGYLQATINFALKHPEVGHEFRDYLKEFMVYAQRLD